MSSGALGFLGQLHGLLVAAPAKALPESLRGKARQDALRLRPGLKVILGEGRIEVDNHWVENGMRSIVLGRKNWLQTSSKATGHWGAAAGGVGI